MDVSGKLTNGAALPSAPVLNGQDNLARPHCDTKALSSSPRQYPTDLTSPILEGDETGTESPNEPITPVDARQSHEFTTIPAKLNQNTPQAPPTSDPRASIPNQQAAPFVIPDLAPSASPDANATGKPAAPPPQPAAAAAAADQESVPTPGALSRRSTRNSTQGFKRSVSNLFRRTSSSATSRPDMNFTEPDYQQSVDALNTDANRLRSARANASMNHSSTTTRSNSPPSPTSPLQMASSYKQTGSSMPTQDDFVKKNNRASTGFSLRGRAINFVHAGSPAKEKQPPKRKPFGRRRSFDSDTPRASHGQGQAGETHQQSQIHPSPWPQMPDSGVGVKSRRLSISLPDDFHVEVSDLLSDYEYQNKLLGRHGKHLGKGATSKVTLMARKGFPTELYAVKEFRNKSKAETAEDYEKKVKSEYSIAKSLHHPNIVETIQLCTHHNRWNHVMEYCADGDLYQLVEKGYLKDPLRASDRLCLFKQVIQGVHYLHSNGIAHRDIKLENCLITNGSKLKITDFGVSEVFSGIHPGLREAGGQCGKNMGDFRLCSPGICGSEPYIAPEVLRKEDSYDPRGMDVWGTAIVMVFLTFGANIWKRAETKTGSANYDMFIKQWEKWNAKHPDPDARITDDDYPYFLPFDEFISPPALRRVLLMMLNPDPTKRASISDIINHRWIKNIECCQPDTYDDPSTWIDASKKGATRVNGNKKIFCHNHMPLVSHGHSLGKMPGQPGY